ncbi:MAG: hypothetical protein RL748_2019 [Pseudomonadota bacterium]
MSANLPPLAPALHKALLAGSRRAPLKAPDLGACAEIADLLQSAAQEANPALLWQAMAANDLWQRAGFTPTTSSAHAIPGAPSGRSMPAANPDSRHCPPAAEHILHLILRGIHAELLETWLARAGQAQARLPHQFLVTLLQDGMNKPHLHDLITPLLDARGHWLVAQHPEWSRRYGTVEADDIESQWQHGNQIDRMRALRVMREREQERATEREHERAHEGENKASAARARLEADWASEAPENRAQLLTCLAVNLSPDDEAFLEAALDDKRKEVRMAAINLLRSMSGSQLMQRCQQRLQALFRIERKTGLVAQIGGLLAQLSSAANAAPNQIELHLSLPDACDKAMKRDGVGAQKLNGLGEKAGWLCDLMRSSHPGFWCQQWQLGPAQVLALLGQQEFKGPLHSAIAQAAASALQYRANQENCDWFALVLSHIGAGWPGFDYGLLPDLMQHFTLLPDAMQEKLLLQWLEQSSQPGAHQRHPEIAISNPAQAMLNQWSQQRSSSQPLSKTLSQAFFQHAQSALHNHDKPFFHEWEIRHRFKQLSEWLDIASLDYTQHGWPGTSWPHWPQWLDAIDKFHETLRFRHQLEASFLETEQ